MFANKAHEKAYNLAKEGKVEQALDAYAEALKTSENPDIYSDRGVLFILNNDKERAMADFNKAIDLQPNYSFRYSARAYAHEYFGDTAASVSDYEKAIELDPQDAVAYNNLGLMQEKLGYKQMAQTNFDLADKLSKQEKNLHELMNNLEGNTPNYQPEKNAPKTQGFVPTEESDIKEETDKNQKAFAEFSKLFTSKEQFRSFLNFLKNGFKIK